MRTNDVLAQGFDHQLEDAYDDFADTFGFGPCGAYAALRRKQGWGEIAACTVRLTDGEEFPHYVIVQDGAIIDLANPLDEPMAYLEIEILEADELPDLVGREEIDWLRKRLNEQDDAKRGLR